MIRTEWRPAGDTFRVMTRGSSPATDNNVSLFICYDNKSCGIIFIVVVLTLVSWSSIKGAGGGSEGDGLTEYSH